MRNKNVNGKTSTLTTFIFLTMILVAMFDNVRGPFIPTIKKQFNANNKEISMTLLACSLGYMIFTYVGGLISEKIGHKKLFIVGFLLIIASPLGLFFSKNFYVYIINLFLLNAGEALISIGVNTLIPLVAIGFQAMIMNLTHFFYGVGATVTQRTAGIMLYNGVNWRQVYLGIAIICSIIFLGFMFINIPKTAETKEYQEIHYKDIFKNKLTYLYMGTLGFYIAAEVNTGNWFVNFMHDNYGFKENKSSFYAALFFGMLTVGRLLGGFIVEKIGYMKSVLLSVLSALILYLVGLILGESGIIVIAISGLFFAIVFPTIVATISSVFKNNISYITGLVITVGSFVGMIINILIGILNDIVGVYKAYYIMPLCLFMCFICMYMIYINTKKNAL